MNLPQAVAGGSALPRWSRAPWQRQRYIGALAGTLSSNPTSVLRFKLRCTCLVVYVDATIVTSATCVVQAFAIVQGQRMFLGASAGQGSVNSGGTGKALAVQGYPVDGWEVLAFGTGTATIVGFAYGSE